jgi:hypothetical protein
MTRDHRDLVIEQLAADNAALDDDLQLARGFNRAVLDHLHQLTIQYVRLQACYYRVLEELRRRRS